MSFITYKGNNIAYQLSGTRTGIPIVFVHGFCSDSRIWDEFKPDFEEERPVVCIDLPGFGSSALIPDVSIEDMAQTVKLVLDQLGITNCIYVGHSMGGYVGMAFAKKYAAQLKGLVMFHSHPFSDSTDQRANRQKVINFIKRQGHVLYAKQLFTDLFAPGYARSNAFLVEKLTFRATSYSADAIIAALQAMQKRTDTSAILSELECPVLFLIGQADSVIDMPTSLAQTHLPNIADIEVLTRVGHMGMFEARKRCSKLIRHFIPFCEQILSAV